MKQKIEFHLKETICIIFFTIELILRCCTCPSIRMFFTNSLNLIDIVAIVPYFVTLIIEVAAARKEEEQMAQRQRLAEIQPGPNVTGLPDLGSKTSETENIAKNESSISHYSDKVAFLAVMRIIRLLRIIRLAKLSRHSRNLNALVKESFTHYSYDISNSSLARHSVGNKKNIGSSIGMFFSFLISSTR